MGERKKNCKKKKQKKNTNTWKLSNMDHWGNQRGNQKYPETDDSENMVTQNLWDAAKVILRARFIAIQSHLKNKKYLK